MREIFKRYNFELTEELEKSFLIYRELLIEWNQIINLTAILDNDEITIRHFIDSYSIINKLLPFKGEVLDMGSGAGFPGLIAAIMAPETNFTLVDSVMKKITFLDDVVKRLELKNVKLLHHHLDKQNSMKKRFNLVISRAFMKPEKLLYFTKNYLTKNGFNVMLLTENQVNKFSNQIKKYKAEVISYPFEGKERFIVKFKKLN